LELNLGSHGVRGRKGTAQEAGIGKKPKDVV